MRDWVESPISAAGEGFVNKKLPQPTLSDFYSMHGTKGMMELASRTKLLLGHLVTRPMWTERAIGPVFFVLFLLTCVLITRRVPESWNDMSRVAAIESLAERGEWSIDRSEWAGRTWDKVFINGHFYSDKMPLLAVAGAVIYGAVHTITGAGLAPDCAETPGGCAYYGLTLLMSGVPAAGLLWLFYEYTRRQGVRLWAGIVATVALGFGTMVWAYATVLNNHIPTALALFASFYLLLCRPRRAVLVAAGVCAGLAAAFELQAALIVPVLGLIALIRARSQVIFFILGACMPVALTVLLDYQITGTHLPPYFVPGAYSYPDSSFQDTPGGSETPTDIVQYAFKMFVGAQGLFAYNPVMLFAVVGMIVAGSARQHALRWEARLLGLSLIALAYFLVNNTGDLGGAGYGERYYLMAVPLLMAFIIFAPPLVSTRLRYVAAIAFALLLVLSVLSANDGARRPWRYVMPPAHLTRNPASGALGFKWNLRLPWR